MIMSKIMPFCIKGYEVKKDVDGGGNEQVTWV